MNRKKLKKNLKKLRRELSSLQDYVDEIAGDQVDAYMLRRQLDFLEGRTGDQAKLFEKRVAKLETIVMGKREE